MTKTELIRQHGRFDKVIKSIKVLRDHCIEPALSSIMSKDSLSKIPEIANFLFGELKIKGLGFNHVSIIPDSGDYSQYDADYETQYAKSLYICGNHSENILMFMKNEWG